MQFGMESHIRKKIGSHIRIQFGKEHIVNLFFSLLFSSFSAVDGGVCFVLLFKPHHLFLADGF